MSKKINLVFLFLLLAITTALGQQRPNKEKIKSLKIAFITEQLNLSSKEAQTFWPLYNAYETKIEVLHKKERQQMRNLHQTTNKILDKEAKRILQQHQAIEEEKHQLHSQFIKKISNVISARKTLLLIKTEKDFRRKLIKLHRLKRVEEHK